MDKFMKQVGFGVIGTGIVGGAWHAYVYSHLPQSKLVAVCDLNEQRANEIAQKYGASAVYTDVWVSMGQEAERQARLEAFQGFAVTAALMATAAPGAIALHCLPAHRGEEIDAEVIDGAASAVWDQAENRLHTAKAVLEWALGVTQT